MRRVLAAIAVCALLSACATAGGVNTTHAQLERAETAAELAYQGAAPLLTSAQRDVAWADLMKVRRLYNEGQDVSAAAALLAADVAAAKGAK